MATGSIEAPKVETPQKILVPIDLSKRAELAVSYAGMLAEGLGAELVLTINVNLPEREILEELADGEQIDVKQAAEVSLRALAQSLAPQVGSSADVHFRNDPAHGILDAAYAPGVDMIVLASHGRTGMTRWLLGSVAEKIARRSPIPVVIVPTRT